VRGQPQDETDDVEVAAWMIYLNRTAFNGLYRVNKRNLFNVPFGKYKNPQIVRADVLHQCASALRGISIRHEDFESVEERAVEGDFVYFDPPYVPLSETASFTSYTAGGFGPKDQIRLCDLARRLKEKGVFVLLSNSGSDEVRNLYQDFSARVVKARRAINSKSDKRGTVKEFLIW